MKVKPTKVMAKAIQDYIRENKKEDYTIISRELNESEIWYNDCYHNIWYEYDETRILEIIYPYNYYASNNVITIKDLLNCYHKSNKTYDSFMEKICELILI